MHIFTLQIDFSFSILIKAVFLRYFECISLLKRLREEVDLILQECTPLATSLQDKRVVAVEQTVQDEPTGKIVAETLDLGDLLVEGGLIAEKEHTIIGHSVQEEPAPSQDYVAALLDVATSQQLATPHPESLTTLYSIPCLQIFFNAVSKICFFFDADREEDHHRYTYTYIYIYIYHTNTHTYIHIHIYIKRIYSRARAHTHTHIYIYIVCVWIDELTLSLHNLGCM